MSNPIIPRSKKDPTKQASKVKRAISEIKDRYKLAWSEIDKLINSINFTYQSNSKDWIMINSQFDDLPLLIPTYNKGKFDLSAGEYDSLLFSIDSIIDAMLLDGGQINLWFFDYITEEANSGILDVFTNLAAQSEIYDERESIMQILTSQPFADRLEISKRNDYSKWADLAGKTKREIAEVIAESIARGVSTKEAASIIKKRMNVSYSYAKSMAQTEMLMSYRNARIAESQRAEEELGVKNRLLWISALIPTTRKSHGELMGKIKTREFVMDFYSRDGNRNNCYCSQSEVVIDREGNPIILESTLKRLKEDREAWEKSAAVFA